MRRQFPKDVWKKVEKRGPDECWEWKGRTTTNKHAYGVIGICGGEYVAHRVAYFDANPGTITLAAPKDKSLRQFVLHRCDNRMCCNPKHLFLGNYDDNNKDTSKKGRARSNMARGEDHHLASLTLEKAAHIRYLAQFNLASTEIAKAFDVSAETARRVMRGMSYAE